MIQLRVFEPDDYEMISSWHEGHKVHRNSPGRQLMPKELLPPIGQIAFRQRGEKRDDLAALWLYLAQACPVCFLEHAITKPGLRLTLARSALLALVDCLTRVAADLGYALMVAHTMPGMARQLEGWYPGDRDLIAMWSPIKK